jgi:ribosome maturation factor RimP
MSSGAPAGQRARIAALVEPVVTGAGYDLEDLSVSQAGRRSLVRVVVDGDGGISLDDIAVVSRAVSAALDDAEAADNALTGRSPYTLEVTSPGVDRPLTLPRHWVRNAGRLVKVTIAGESVTGRITSASADTVTLDVAGSPRQVSHADLGHGSVQVEFARPKSAAADADTDTDTDDDIDDAEDTGRTDEEGDGA